MLASEVRERLQDALKIHGREKMDEAARALLDIEGDPQVAKLKAEVKKLCWGLLGPDGDQWDDFYLNVENPPPNPYKPAVATKTDDAPHSEVATDESPQEVRQPKRWAVPPEMTAEAMIRRLSDDELRELISEAKWAIQHYGPKSRKARPFKKDVAMAEAECERRGIAHQEKVEPTIDEVAEALANTVEEETGMGAIVAHPLEIERLQKATTTRLHEMLDMDLYEVAKYGPDTVTHQEAAREASLIEAELQRRKAA